MNKLKQQDRVMVHFGKKMNLGNYESMDIQVSLSTYAEKNETLKEAFDRAADFVTKQWKYIENDMKILKKKRKIENFK